MASRAAPDSSAREMCLSSALRLKAAWKSWAMESRNNFDPSRRLERDEPDALGALPRNAKNAGGNG